jgi:hypothetical protein
MALAIARLSLSAITKTDEAGRSDSGGLGVSSHEERLLPHTADPGACDVAARAAQD